LPFAVVLKELASCVVVGELNTVSELCDGWQAVAVGDLYTISELCGSWQVVCRWEALWPLASYIPLAS
jgi:hypothetical protein